DQRRPGDLAVHPGRVVHPDDAGLAARHRRDPPAAALEPAGRCHTLARSRRARCCPRGRQGAGMSDVLLYVNGVTVSFDGFKALNELSLVVEEGELRTIIGPNGAGKTTMMDVVTGKTRP